MITFCDNLRFFLICQLKHEVGRKSLLVSLDGLIESACLDAIQFRQIGIDHDFLTAYKENPSENGLNRDNGRRIGHLDSNRIIYFRFTNRLI